MATVRGIWAAALRCQYKAPRSSTGRLVAARAIGPRSLSTTSRRWDDAKAPSDVPPAAAESKSSTAAPAAEEVKASPAEDAEARQRKLEIKRLVDEADADYEKHPKFDWMSEEDVLSGAFLKRTIRELEIETPELPGKLDEEVGMLYDGEERSEEVLSDPEFEEDDVNSLAHAELEQHRELRQYARIAAWEMPLLAKLAKTFEPPTEEQILRFRYTTYMGESHPAEKKVVVEFCPQDIPDLSEVQVSKMIKLLGSRYNPEKEIAKMSCEMFATQTQNKRYLGDLVDTLIKEARDPADTFEDIPIDTRHHVWKQKPRFPEAWRMTDARRAQLDALRQQERLLDATKEQEGKLVDGVAHIEAAQRAPEPVAIPEPVMAGKGGRPRVAVRR